MADPTWENPIKSFFTNWDIQHMEQVKGSGFDLGNYKDVKENAHLIYEVVSAGVMPPGHPWAKDRVATFHQWLSNGCPED